MVTKNADQQMIGAHFEFISTIAGKNKEDYSEFTKARSKYILENIKSEEKWFLLLKNYLSRVIRDMCNNLELSIKNKKTTGQEFVHCVREIDRIKRELAVSEINYPTDLFKLANDTITIWEDVQEKLKIERENKRRNWKQFWLGIVFGAIFGYLLPVIVAYIRSKF